MVDEDTRANTARASPTQPVERSPENQGNTIGRPGIGSASSIRCACSRGGSSSVDSSQVTARPTSFRAPPTIERCSSMRLHHRPRGRLSTCPSTSARMAPEVAADRTTCLLSTRPSPTDWLCPSEMGANQTASARWGQAARTSVRGVRGRLGWAMGDRRSGLTPTTAHSSASQAFSARFSMPVQAAVDVPAAVVPIRRSQTYSPIESQRTTRSNVWGSFCLSHRKRAGR